MATAWGGVGWGRSEEPGKQHSLLSFTKKTAPSENVNAVRHDGFPTKVLAHGAPATSR